MVTRSSVSTAPDLESIIDAAESRLPAIAKVVPDMGWLTGVLEKTIAEYLVEEAPEGVGDGGVGSAFRRGVVDSIWNSVVGDGRFQLFCSLSELLLTKRLAGATFGEHR